MDTLPITGIRLLFLTAESMMMGLECAFFAAKTAQKKLTLSLWLGGWLVLQIAALPEFILKSLSGTGIVFFAAVCLVYMAVFDRRRGFDLFKNAMLLFGICMGADLLMSLIAVSVPAFRDQLQSATDKFANPIFLFTTAIDMLAGMGLTLLYCFLQTASGRQRIWEALFRFLRPTAVTICLILLLIQTLGHLDASLSLPEKIAQASPEEISIIILLAAGVSYMNQDIRYLSQRRLNDSLTQQQQIQDILLQETRVFRHDIANLLYGFQGVLLSEDRTQAQAYYDNMVSTCAIINNENVVAVRRLPSLSLRALLMRKIQEANDLGIPLYVYADEALRDGGVQEARVCEMVGILLDNAIEAARVSRAPFVSFEAHNTAEDLEIVVRNTHSESAAQALDDLFPSQAPSKEGHQGVGLSRLREMAGREKGLLFNLYYRGRFVEASLLFSPHLL